MHLHILVALLPFLAISTSASPHANRDDKPHRRLIPGRAVTVSSSSSSACTSTVTVTSTVTITAHPSSSTSTTSTTVKSSTSASTSKASSSSSTAKSSISTVNSSSSLKSSVATSISTPKSSSSTSSSSSSNKSTSTSIQSAAPSSSSTSTSKVSTSSTSIKPSSSSSSVQPTSTSSSVTTKATSSSSASVSTSKLSSTASSIKATSSSSSVSKTSSTSTSISKTSSSSTSVSKIPSTSAIASKSSATSLISSSTSTTATATATSSSFARGLGLNSNGYQKLSEFTGLGWYYNWALAPFDSSAVAGFEFVPMVWGEGSIPSVSGATFPSGTKYILGFNEPDMSSSVGGSNLNASYAATLHQKWTSQLTQKGLQIGSPAVARGSTTWFSNWVTACAGKCQFDFVPIHFYGDNAADMISYIKTFPAQGKPIWVTEWSCMDYSSGYVCTASEVNTFINTVITWFRSAEGKTYVDRWAWFGAFPDQANSSWGMEESDGSPNALADYYLTL